MAFKLGDISPLAGAVSGKGMFGKGLANIGEALGPAAGIMPILAQSARDKRREQEEEDEAKKKAASKPTGMKKGGLIKSSASKRADGCAVKGKTRGKMV